MYKDVHRLIKPIIKPAKLKAIFKLTNILLVSFCLLFSFFLFKPQLSYTNQTIYRSPIYWDLHWHAALIQNFTYGDNFPPQNEAFGGLPHTYHFFWGVLTGIYESLGMNLVDSINFASIVPFFFVLLTIIGLSEEFFDNKSVGFITIILTITSSSFHFTDYFKNVSSQNLQNIILNIFTTKTHPWTASFTTATHSFYYNGTFFNLFYFIEERQLIIGVLYLLLSCFIIYKRKNLSNSSLTIIGGLMGAYFLWHLHITIMILCALIFLLVFDSDRKKTLLMLTGFFIIFMAHVIYFKLIAQSAWFVANTESFPKINLGFSDQENKLFSLSHAFNWYLYSYGLKLFLLPISLLFMWRKNKKACLLICSIIIPTFILLNTFQLAPGSVYENHKFLRPMNILIDLAVAFIVYKIFFKRINLLLKISGFIIMFFLTISGIIELMPFINSKPTEMYAYYPSQITQSIQWNTQKHAVFTGSDDYQIQLAGRKMFLGNILGEGLGLNKEKRQKVISNIYASSDIKTFCFLTRNYKIDYIEFNNSQGFVTDFFKKLPHFSTINDKNEQVFFVDSKKSCA